MSSGSEPYRDREGKTVADYPRPSVAVDTAVLTVRDDRLCVVLVAAGGEAAEMRLPGTFLHEGERLADAVLRSLREKAGVEGLAPRQLHVFDDPGRDDRGWVLSVAHVDAVPLDRLGSLALDHLVTVDDLPPLKYDHAEIIRFAVDALRADYRASPDPAGFLRGAFTMRRLRKLHESVLGEQLMPDTFRRAMLPRLQGTGNYGREGRGRPAELYERRRFGG